MLFEDSYKIVTTKGEGLYKEKGSKFIAEAFPVYSEAEVKERVAEVKKKYFDAKHHCYAFMIGPDKACYRSSDDGEPSGTAGKPILNQILSKDVTNVCVVALPLPHAPHADLHCPQGGAAKEGCCRAIVHAGVAESRFQRRREALLHQPVHGATDHLTTGLPRTPSVLSEDD